MKTLHQSFIFILFGLFAVNGCDFIKERDTAVVTDQSTYYVQYDPTSPNNSTLVIKTSFKNTTGDVVFLPKCKNPYEPTLEFYDSNEWKEILAKPVLLCKESPITILWGKTHTQEYKLTNGVFLQLIKDFKIPQTSEGGLYRLVFPFTSKRNGQSLIKKEWRTTNPFYLVLDK